MSKYYNPKTGETAKVNSPKADKDGNAWVEINGGIAPKAKLGRVYQSVYSGNLRTLKTEWTFEAFY